MTQVCSSSFCDLFPFYLLIAFESTPWSICSLAHRFIQLHSQIQFGIIEMDSAMQHILSIVSQPGAGKEQLDEAYEICQHMLQDPVNLDLQPQSLCLLTMLFSLCRLTCARNFISCLLLETTNLSNGKWSLTFSYINDPSCWLSKCWTGNINI